MLVDLNILLDVLLRREPFVADSAALWKAAEEGRIDAVVSADPFSTLYYIAAKASGPVAARDGVSLVSRAFEVVAVDHLIINEANASPMADFEDAIQYRCALRAGAESIITRDAKHFGNIDVRVLSPREALTVY